MEVEPGQSPEPGVGPVGCKTGKRLNWETSYGPVEVRLRGDWWFDGAERMTAS
jgi:hypothetical protein